MLLWLIASWTCIYGKLKVENSAAYVRVVEDSMGSKGMVRRAKLGTKGSATVNFDRSFRALSKREDSRPCASAQGRDGKEDEGCWEKEEGNGYMFHCICLDECYWTPRHLARQFARRLNRLKS